MYQAVRLNSASQYTPSNYSSSRSAASRDDVESNHLPSSEDETRLSYKPPAIRLPFLLFYFAIFASCLGLIEWILDKTEKPVLADSSLLPLSDSSAAVSKRALLSSCQNEAVYSSDFQNELSAFSALCAAYSATYLPYTTSLPGSLQTAFPTWKSMMAMNQKSRTDLSAALTRCGASTQTSAADGKFTAVIYDACTSSSITFDHDACWAEGSLNLVDGTSIQLGWTAVCAASTTAQIDVASQSVGTTSSQLATPPSVKSTTATSAQITPASHTLITQILKRQVDLASQTNPAVSYYPITSELTITSQPLLELLINSSTTSQLNSTSPTRVSQMTLPASHLTITSQTVPLPAPEASSTPASHMTLTSQTVNGLPSSASSIASSHLTITSQQPTGSPAPSVALTITSQKTQVTSVGTVPPTAQLTITSQPLPPSTSVSSHLTITSQTLTLSSSAASQLTITSQLLTGSPAPSSQISITSQSLTVGNPAPTSQLTLTSQKTSKVVLTTGPVMLASTTAEITITSQRITPATLLITTPTTPAPHSTTLSGQTYIYTYTSTFFLSGSIVQTSIITKYSTYAATSWTTATRTMTDTASSSPTSAATSTPILAATSAASQTSASNDSAYFVRVPYHSTDVVVMSTFTELSYFAALFLPPILAVIVKAIWEMVAASLKMIEPFERLEDRSGVSAKYSILSQYLSSIVSLDALRAIGHGRLLPLWTLTTYLLVTIGAPIASISMSIYSSEECFIDGIHRPCAPVWVIHNPIIRAVEGVIVVCMILLVFFMWSTRKSCIAVSTNPSSIASVASLMNYRPLVRDLERIDPLANSAEFASALEEHLFRLEAHQTRNKALWRYGIVGTKQKPVMTTDAFEGAWLRGTDLSDDTAYMPVNDSRSQYTNQPKSQPVKPFLRDRKYTPLTIDILHLCTTLTLFALLLGYYLDGGSDPLNNFFNSGQILPKFVLVGLATIVDIQIKNLERLVRTTEPYRRLAGRNARPETTILLPLNGTCWSNLPQCFHLLFKFELSQGRMLWQTIVSVVTALSDFNIIAVAGVPWEGAQTTPSFFACAYTSIAITSCVLLVILVTMIWWRRSEVIRDMPRQPDTIGTIMSYLCSSELVREWMDSRTVRAEELRAVHMSMLVHGDGRRYFFGKVPGMDGRERWCIDIDSWRDEKVARSLADTLVFS